MFIVTSYCKYYYRHPQPCYLPACHVNTNANTLNKSNIASQSFILVKKKELCNPFSIHNAPSAGHYAHYMRL